jgi:hypothetical protein
VKQIDPFIGKEERMKNLQRSVVVGLMILFFTASVVPKGFAEPRKSNQGITVNPVVSEHTEIRDIPKVEKVTYWNKKNFYIGLLGVAAMIGGAVAASGDEDDSSDPKWTLSVNRE